MKTILNKLRSRCGASMILAMVFMLFCSFIGGTVLASATANAQRVAQMAEQQDFLLERSAALLVSDQLQLNDDKFLRMSVVDAYQTIQPVIVGDGGVVTNDGDPTFKRVVTFQVLTDTTPTNMHRLLLESTVWRYLLENEVKNTDEIVLLGFPEDTDNLGEFLFQPMALPSEYSATTNKDLSGSMSVTAQIHNSEDVAIPAYTANFSSGRGTHIYDFFVDFGADSQLKMTLNGYSGTTNPIEVVAPPTEKGGKTVQITTNSTQTTITWQDPLIEKGGAT